MVIAGPKANYSHVQNAMEVFFDKHLDTVCGCSTLLRALCSLQQPVLAMALDAMPVPGASGCAVSQASRREVTPKGISHKAARCKVTPKASPTSQTPSKLWITIQVLVSRHLQEHLIAKVPEPSPPSARQAEILLWICSLGAKSRTLMATISSFKSISLEPSVTRRSKASS